MTDEDKLFQIPTDFDINWPEFSVKNLDVQAVWLFLYAQRGKPMCSTLIQQMLHLEESQVRHALKIINVYAEGALQWTDL